MLSASEQFAGGGSPRANRSGFPACSPTPGRVDCVDRFCAASLCCVCPQQRQTEEHLTLPQALVWSAACKLSRANQSMRYLRCSLWKPSPGQGPRTLQAVRPPDDAAGRRAAQQTREAAISGALPQRGSRGCVAACAKPSCCRGVPAQGGTLARITTIKKIGALGESRGHKRQTVGTNLTPGETMTATATKHVTAPCKWTMGSSPGNPLCQPTAS